MRQVPQSYVRVALLFSSRDIRDIQELDLDTHINNLKKTHPQVEFAKISQTGMGNHSDNSLHNLKEADIIVFFVSRNFASQYQSFLRKNDIFKYKNNYNHFAVDLQGMGLTQIPAFLRGKVEYIALNDFSFSLTDSGVDGMDKLIRKLEYRINACYYINFEKKYGPFPNEEEEDANSIWSQLIGSVLYLGLIAGVVFLGYMAYLNYTQARPSDDISVGVGIDDTSSPAERLYPQ